MNPPAKLSPTETRLWDLLAPGKVVPLEVLGRQWMFDGARHKDWNGALRVHLSNLRIKVEAATDLVLPGGVTSR